MLGWGGGFCFKQGGQGKSHRHGDYMVTIDQRLELQGEHARQRISTKVLSWKCAWNSTVTVQRERGA